MENEKIKQDFLDAGFTEVNPELDPLTKYEKALISDDVIEENDLEEYEIPKLFYGTNGINTGFGIFTGSCLVWIDSKTPSEASEFASKILQFEPID